MTTAGPFHQHQEVLMVKVIVTGRNRSHLSSTDQRFLARFAWSAEAVADSIRLWGHDQAAIYILELANENGISEEARAGFKTAFGWLGQ